MYSVFRNLAIIILSAKFFGLVARKFKAPQVVGEIIAVLIIGPCLLNLVHISDTISIFAEIGVVLLMFTTGLGTNLKELIKAGPIATLIACVGVAVPLAGGTLLYSLFYGFSALGSQEFYRALFIGTIMTATSVSITVATLQELGHLKSFLGTTIVSAAVIDDVIGIVVLTCVLGASSGTGTGLGKVLMNTVLFFATAIGVGLLAHFAMKWLDKRNPHTQRITIVSMAFCFAMAYIAEAYFGIADITGAYIAGIVLCTLEDAPYVERRVDISNYVLFAPIFFASIGLKTDISGLTPEILLFSVCFVVVALITKIISRLQFCSVAVRLAETLTGKSITPAAANTFTDTNNAYVLKAYAAGITTGTSATTFSPNATLNRQQMATFLRRTLQYVEKNSGYSYTSYTSKLASYTDNALVQSWAKEAMAFMNALDLVKGTTATTLNPNGTCTIEQAVIVAERSVYAHQIGWYQAAPVTNVYSYNGSTGEIEREDGEYTSFDSTNASLHPGDLVWITGKLTDVSNLLATAPGTTVDQCVYSAYLPGINPYTGQIMYLHYRDLIPVRG